MYPTCIPPLMWWCALGLGPGAWSPRYIHLSMQKGYHGRTRVLPRLATDKTCEDWPQHMLKITLGLRLQSFNRTFRWTSTSDIRWIFVRLFYTQGWCKYPLRFQYSKFNSRPVRGLLSLDISLACLRIVAMIASSTQSLYFIFSVDSELVYFLFVDLNSMLTVTCQRK